MLFRSDLGGATLLQGAGCNIVALAGPDGALMIDGGLAASADALIAAVKSATRTSRINMLINTHWHPEQTGSNETLAQAGATIIAQQNTKLWLTTDVTWPWDHRTVKPLPKEARPGKTFFSQAEFDVGGRKRSEEHRLNSSHT